MCSHPALSSSLHSSFVISSIFTPSDLIREDCTMRLLGPALWKESPCCLSTPRLVNAHAKASTILSSFSAKEQTILALWLKFSTRNSVKIVKST